MPSLAALAVLLAAAPGGLARLERSIFHWINCELHGPWLTPFFLHIQSDKIAVPLFLVVAAVLAFADRHRALRAIGTAAAAFGLCMGIATVMWATIPRARPPHHFEHHLTTPEEIAGCAGRPDAVVMLIGASSRRSFPSRHALTIGSFVTALWLASRTAGVLAAVYGALVAVGRVHIAKHWPTDMLGGIAIGALVAWAVWRLLPRFLGHFGLRHLVAADARAVGEPAPDEPQGVS